MPDQFRQVILGVFCALAVVAAMRAADLASGIISFLLVVIGVLPRASLLGSAGILAAIALLALGAKAVALFLLARRPDKLTWLARSWTWPIVLAVLALLTTPMLTVLHTKRNLALASRELPYDIGDWFLADSYVSIGAQLATAAVWAAVLLVAFARLRAAAAPMPAR
ncbi:MAG TPA: hypothetical protein VML75_26105 [Kofleriaceae bacterium]|nr:hypothetical protein [Kofleriaceae bacterium]